MFIIHMLHTACAALQRSGHVARFIPQYFNGVCPGVIYCVNARIRQGLIERAAGLAGDPSRAEPIAEKIDS